ncbi:MAG: hypothetical protein LC130_28560 [Bryobacterales bacterium]|nr:hypothetical protein [Bryobacterales bacterium]
MSEAKVTIPLTLTAKVAARWRAEIEARVAELFKERFPVGSDGPFDIGMLYEQATWEVAEKVKEEIQATFQRDVDRFLGREVGHPTLTGEDES